MILITGGAGSIGSNLALRLFNYHPKSIRIFDSDENGLVNLKLSIPEKHMNRYRFFLGDIRDKARIDRAVEDTDYVYHMAALKHVSIGNYNPFEVIKTNIIGTQNILESVLDAKTVKKFIFFSSDKAADPNNTYGVSKLVGEKLTISATSYRGDRPTEFCCLRFGNVVGTRGSVWHIWGKQMKSGKSLTVTDRKMRRFFITMSEAIEFIIKITPVIRGKEIIIPKMKEYSIESLARSLSSDNIDFTNAVDGEKVTEHLFASSEKVEEAEDFWVIRE